MCKTWVYWITLLCIGLPGNAVLAELKLVGNFDGLTGESPDNQACTGELGGAWDTETEGTGSIDLVLKDGSQTVTVMGHSNGEDPRAFGFNGISNTIDNSESGIAFFRFMLRSGTQEPRTYMGFITDTSSDPIDTWNSTDPMSLHAGVRWRDNGAGGLDIVSLDGATVLKADLPRSQWYNVWMVANNVADTFDLYLSDAEGPAGEATRPKAEDLIQNNIPFLLETADPLTGIIVANPGGGEGGQAERIYLDEVWWDGDQGLDAPTQAKKPSPTNRAEDVARDVVLTWRPSPSAVAHDVYFGENADDVANATVDDPLGAQLSPAQDANSYVPAVLLDLGKTYYWRVDEVNDLDENGPYVGSVWSFTVEPMAFNLTQTNMTVRASGSAGAEQIPENTINGSGLDSDDPRALPGHGIDGKTMWLSNDDPNGAWIEYAFDKTYKMHDMWVWNHNALNESTFGLGTKDVVVSYSTDGALWTPVDGVNQFAQAPGLEDYQANTLIDLSGVLASHIRIDVSSNWVGFFSKFGLSEVRFSVIPTAARLPQPETGTMDVDPAPVVSLSWRSGREAAEHVLYLGTDEQAVMDGTAEAITLTDAAYLATDLKINSIYYWRVDELNEAETPTLWPGDVWAFSTVETRVVDDFEDYNNVSPSLVFQTWVDGLGYLEDDYLPEHPGNGTGAVVGYDIWSWDSPHYLGDVMEKSNPHGGGQCMPVAYWNGESPFVSEARITFGEARDWTGHGVDSLGLWYRGSSAVDSFSYDGDNQTYSVIAAGGNILGTADTFHFVYQKLTGDGEMMARVESIDPVDPWSKAGVMIRQGLETGAPHAFVGISPSKGVTFARRATDNADTESTDVPGILAPYWLKLVLRDNTVYASVSADGSAWEAVGDAEPLFLSGDVTIGMAVSSHAGRTEPPCEAVFSNVSTSGGAAAGVLTEAASISEEPLNMPEPLYLAMTDVTGRRVEVELNATGTARNEWTLGTVDLTAISGDIDVSAIKDVAVGVGHGAAGSDGLIFIDDVTLFNTH